MIKKDFLNKKRDLPKTNNLTLCFRVFEINSNLKMVMITILNQKKSNENFIKKS